MEMAEGTNHHCTLLSLSYLLVQIPDEPNVTPRPVRTAAEWQEDKPLPGESFYQPALKPEFQIINQAMLKKENPRKKARLNIFSHY